MERSKKNRLLFIISLIIGLSVMFPVFWGCLYALPSGDDFSNSLGWINADYNHFIFLLKNTIEIYKSTQGTYTGAFILGFPVYYEMGIWGLRFFLAFVVVFYTLTYVLLVNSFLKIIDIQQKYQYMVACIVVTMSLFYLIGKNNIDQIFYWYTGVAVYTLPICFMFLGLTLYFIYVEGKKKTLLIGSMFFVFLAAGGSLDIAALLCSVILGVLLYQLYAQRHVNASVFVFCIALLGAIVNVIAPGNFLRHEKYDAEIRILQSIENTYTRVTTIISSDFRSGLILTLLVISFLLGYKLLRNSSFEFKIPGIMTIYSFLAVLITDFPVELGYSGIDFPSRCYFVDRLAVVIYIIIIGLWWGGWCSKKGCFDISNTIVLVLVLICAIPLSSYFAFSEFTSLTQYKSIYHICNGDFRRISNRETALLEQIINSNENDVIVYRDRDREKEWTAVREIYISEDSSDWINGVIAAFYGKHSITLKYNE